MKLHSEISIGRLILYACIVASLSGVDSFQNNSQSSTDPSADYKGSTVMVNRAIDNADSSTDGDHDVNEGIQKN